MLKEVAFALVAISSFACEDDKLVSVQDVEERVSQVVDKVDDLKREVEEMVKQRKRDRAGDKDEASTRRP